MDTVKTIPATLFLYASRRIKVADVAQTAGELIDPLYATLEASGLEPTGPLEFHYIDMDGNPERPFMLHIALPVKEAKPVSGECALKTSEPFKCVSTIYTGAMTGLPQAWQDVIGRTIQSGKRLGVEGREIYWNFSAPDAADNSTEILLGIE